MADRTVKVTLSAQVAGYIAGMEEAASATRKAGSEAEKMAQQSQAFEQMGRASMLAGGAVAAGLGLSAKAAIDWETAWAGVTKTVDGSETEMAALEGQLRSLTEVLPASHAEIAGVAEAAGQLGIERENVAAFTKTMIDLGESTNLSSEEAATSLARFMTVMGTAKEDVSGLGSALVELGNNYATTEAEIMAMAMRLSGAGAQIGMSEGQILGLSTALSSVGIEAEAGGSAMSKVMIDIASSVDQGGERMQQFADISGLSADEFAAKWRSDPGEALAAFVTGLSNAEAQGKSTIGVLEELGITEVRMRDALLRSASAADEFSAAMATGDKAVEANTALTAEAEKRYETVASKIGIMRNQVVDAAISMGEHLLPALEFVVDGIGSFADLLSGVSEGPLGQFVAFGGLLAAGILLTGGVALAAVPKIAAYKVALETLGISTSVLTGRLKAVGAFMTGPWGIAIAAAATSAYMLNSAIKDGVPTHEELKNALLTSADAADVFAEAGKRAGAEKFFMGDYAKNLEDLSGLFERTGDTANNFFSHALAGTRNKDIGALGVLEDLGNVLAELSTTDLPTAQGKFKELAESQSLTAAETQTMLDRMPAFKDALVAQATELGLAANDSNLLALAMGKIGPAAKEGAEGATEQEEALNALDAKAQETREAVSALADEIRGFGSATFDLREANRSLEQAYDDLSASLEKNGASFDITTEAGRETQSALDKVASATNIAAASMVEAGASQDEVNAKLTEGKNQLIDILAPYMGSRDAAAAYVEQLDLISPEKVTDVIENAAKAKGEVEGYNATLGTIPAEKNTKVNADTATAQSNLSTFLNTLSSIPTQITTTINQHLKKFEENAGADGFIEAYANGGFASGIYKGGAPIHKFAEPETIWEAYISGKPDQRDRNRQIWAEAGNRLGVDMSASSAPPVVYVQNPFTGEYLIAKQVQIAEGAIDRFNDQQGQAGRWAR